MQTVNASEMNWQRGAAVTIATLFLAGCGQPIRPVAGLSPVASLAPTPHVSPTPSPISSPTPSPPARPSPEPTPPVAVASVVCKGAASSAMVVVAGVYLYDVADPIHPRLVCSATNTYMQLAGGNKIAYTVALSGGKAKVVWRDLTTGLDTQAALLPADPGGAKNWTADGSLEVYAGQGKAINESSWLVPIHLYSNAGDHLLFSITSGASGLESRWSQLPILEFSANHTYFAISDARYAITSSSMRIFSVADRRQLLLTTEGPGGTWVADDRFVWSSPTTGSLVQWTPQGGVSAFRPEKTWFGVSSSVDGRWLAGTVLSSAYQPRVLITPVAGGVAVTTGLGSAPGFVSATVLWYIGEKACAEADPCGADPTFPDGTVHAYDVTTNSDKVIQFRAGEAPQNYWICCSARI